MLTEQKALRRLSRKNHRAYKREIFDKLLSLDNKDVTSFWNIIDKMKEKKIDDSSVNISAKEWYDHFKDLMNKKIHR